MVSSTYGAGFWSRNFYNTLVSYDDNGKIQGELAETWEISDDGKTYAFHLRDGVKFSDGTPLTSEAVKMTLEAVVTHLGPQNGAFGKLTTLFDKLETPDEKTFVMTLKTPYYAALDNLTMALPLGIVNPAAFEGGVEKAYENCVSATMGTGPYMFERVEGDTYTDEPLAFLLEDAGIKEVISPYYMGRIVDFVSFIEKYPFKPSVLDREWKFKLIDPIMECNQGYFYLTISREGHGQVMRIMERCEDTIDIQTMTTMLMGYKRPEYLAKIGRIQAAEWTIDMLEDAIEQQTPYISDYF